MCFNTHKTLFNLQCSVSAIQFWGNVRAKIHTRIYSHWMVDFQLTVLCCSFGFFSINVYIFFAFHNKFIRLWIFYEFFYYAQFFWPLILFNWTKSFNFRRKKLQILENALSLKIGSNKCNWVLFVFKKNHFASLLQAQMSFSLFYVCLCYIVYLFNVQIEMSLSLGFIFVLMMFKNKCSFSFISVPFF